MIGNNKILINKATMNSIIQDWFDRNAPALNVQIVDVAFYATDNMFPVEVTEKKKEGTGPAVSDN